MVGMASGSAYGVRVEEAHAAGDLYVHGFNETGGYWASWDSTMMAERGHVSDFVEKASREWHGFQRLSRFDSLIASNGNLLESIHRLSEGQTRVLLGFEEQARREGVLEGVFSVLRSLETGRIVPFIMFTDDYDWRSNGDLPIFNSVNSLASPIFIHMGKQGTVIDPWLDGLAPGISTGMLDMITLNLPRAAYEAGNEHEFYDRVSELTKLAVDGLKSKRLRLEEELRKGEMPATSSIVDSFEDFPCAVSVVGVNEALQNLVDRGISSMQGKVIGYKILELIRGILIEEERGKLLLAAGPSGDAAYRLAKMDRVKYPEIKTAGVEEPFYTASSCLPVNYTDDLYDALEHQKKLQNIYMGGTLFNIVLNKELEDVEGCKLLTRRIVEKVGLPCFAFSPPFSVEGVGRFDRVGYWYKPVSEMEAGEKEEVRLRSPFDVASGW